MIEPVSTFFKEEKDFLYRKGEVKGREEERLKVITNLIAKPDLSDEQSLAIAEAPIGVVKSVRESLKN